jgi:starch-binding outer membrane protein, SusD/RagB family
MKSMKRITLYTIGILSLVASGCERSIDVDPTSVLTSQTFWKSEGDAVGALNGMYVNLRSEAVQNLFILGEGRSQTMSQALAGTVGLDIFYLNSLAVGTTSVNWGGLYKVVDAANLIIKYVPDISIASASTKSRILAQAYTMRAYVYFVMAKSWGAVPLRLTPTEGYDPIGIQLEKAPVADIFKQIKLDLDQALTLFPDNNFEAGRNRWSLPGANTLKAEVYLWTARQMNGGTADYQAALSALDAVQKASVSLLPSFGGIFSYDNKGNSEVIMASRFQVLESDNNYYQYMYLNSSNNPSAITQATKDVIGVIGTGNAGNSIMQVAASVRNQFSSDDQRRAATFYEIKSTAGDFITTIVAAKGNGTVVSGVRHFKNDVMLYRYADVLLMKAEAKNGLGLDPTPEINEIRNRAYGATASSHQFVKGSVNENDAAILKERLLEFCTEGKYWSDLRRFGKVFELVPSLQTRASDTYLLLFPIGNSVRSLEPKVVENQGWQ